LLNLFAELKATTIPADIFSTFFVFIKLSNVSFIIFEAYTEAKFIFSPLIFSAFFFIFLKKDKWCLVIIL